MAFFQHSLIALLGPDALAGHSPVAIRKERPQNYGMARHWEKARPRIVLSTVARPCIPRV